MSKGKLIVFEGIDGCGKSTIIKLVGEKLINKNSLVYLTQEPTHSELGKRADKLISYSSDETDTEKFLLIIADRLNHVLQFGGIKDQVNDGKIVLCDRYYPATYVYQGTKIPKYLLDTANDIIKREMDFDYLLYFEIDIEIAMARINNRGNKIEQNENFSALRTAKNRYKSFLSEYIPKEKIIYINANNSIDKVYLNVLKEMKKILNN
ncbi:thymidylate kinase [Enterococcus sp. DIV0724b]|uniref:dTMP kinase n=1 Tax=Enterococcus sp. DIV0724b TaxID=2774694 RepID=UPI003D2FAADC